MSGEPGEIMYMGQEAPVSQGKGRYKETYSYICERLKQEFGMHGDTCEAIKRYVALS